MAELHQILGSLFSDVAQSVFTSDLYSRDISRYYEQDGLLRHFPVPRTEIAELEVELKFAIGRIEMNPSQSVSREASSATLFIDFSYRLSECFFEDLHTALQELAQQNRLKEGKDRTTDLNQVASEVNAIYLRQDLLRFFQRNHANLIEAGVFKVREARTDIRAILDKYFSPLKLKDLPEKEKRELFERVIAASRLDSELEALAEALKFAWNQAGDFKLDVEVSAQKLSELEGDHLSSVHVRTRVRNYKWTEVEHPGRTWWTLNPE